MRVLITGGGGFLGNAVATALLARGDTAIAFDTHFSGDNEAIAEFCSKTYGVTFPVTEKVSIIGPHPHPLFIAMREEYTSDVLPKWNFHKYLFGRDGGLTHHWPSNVEPDDSGFRHEVERNLNAWTM